MDESANSSDLGVASIFYGFFLAFGLFTLAKVMRQTWSIQKRTKSVVNWYLFMIWAEVIVNFVLSTTTYLYLLGVIQPR
jgi:hypothetical protein